MAVSSIEAQGATRLFELWLEQKFGERLSVRAWQLAVDSEFFTTDTGANFVNSTFGWAGIWAADLPNGGNAYPLATRGARAKVTLSDNLTFLAAIYNGNPADENGQSSNRNGTDFRTQDDPFLIQELQYTYNKRPKGGAKDGGKGGYKDSTSAGTTGLPGTIKIGAWQHTGGSWGSGEPYFASYKTGTLPWQDSGFGRTGLCQFHDRRRRDSISLGDSRL
jgi:porin